MDANDALLRDFLVDSGLVSRSRMSDVLERLANEANQERSAASLGAALAQAGLLERDELRRAQAHALGVPFVELDPHDIQTEAMFLVPEPLARARSVFAYNQSNQGVEIAVLDLADIKQLQPLVGARVLPRLTSEHSMRIALQHYQKHLKEKFGEMLTAGRHLTDALIRHAILSRAGGVHVDAGHLSTLVRYQIGHALHEAFVLPEQLGKQLVDQLKMFAKLLPVSRPQEGKFKVEYDGETIHVRVHTFPVAGDPSRQGGAKAERVHLRLAREGARGYTLESLGFHGEALEATEHFLSRRSGLLVALGGEAAGKTTLLHTLADLVASPHATLLHARSATEVRAALKHDPEVLVVDNVADEATAALVTAAAARGVQILAGATYEAPPLAGDIVIQLARVRRLCTKTFDNSVKLSRSEQEQLAHYSIDGQERPLADFTRLLAALKNEYVVTPNIAWKDVTFAQAVPCSECAGGYAGHIGLQQVEDSGLPGHGGLAGLNIIEDGLFKAAQGSTSLDEILTLLS